MSSSPPTEGRKDVASTEPEKASIPLPIEVVENSHASTEPPEDQTLQQSRPSTPKLALIDTLPGFKPCAENTAIEEEVPDDEIPYPDIEEDSLLPPPDFKPYFTLIEDPITGEHHHPTVHYLFADDDQEILTAAALETVSEDQQQQGPEDERFVIVDMNADGKEVVATSSLSPDWQTLKTKATQAPSWGDQSQVGDRGLMLRISGQEAELCSERRQKGDVDGLLKTFDDLAGTLDEVLGSAIMDTETSIAP